MCKKIVTGVYLIKNNINLKVRVGSASNCDKRFSTYKAELRNASKNANKNMQSDYNEFGEQSFDFIILEECTEEDLFKREQFWLKEYSDCAMYNKNRVVNTNKKVSTVEEKEIKRKSRSKATSGVMNGHCTVLTELKASEILWLKNNTKMKQKDIAVLYGCSPNLVSRIGKDRWKNVVEIMPLNFIEIEKVDCTGILSTLDANINISL